VRVGYTLAEALVEQKRRVPDTFGARMVAIKILKVSRSSEDGLVTYLQIWNAFRTAPWKVAKQVKGVLKAETLEAVADRGYFSSLEILACHEAGITVTLPKPLTSGAKSEGRFGKQDFVYLPEQDAYRCPAGEQCSIASRARRVASGYGATGPQPVKIVRSNPGAPPGQSGGFHGGSMSTCSMPCSSALMQNPHAMRLRRETVEHPFGTMKARMGATHFVTKTLPKVAAEMALSVLAYNLTRVMNIVGTKPLMAAIMA
jgi:hypothetical protein